VWVPIFLAGVGTLVLLVMVLAPGADTPHRFLFVLGKRADVMDARATRMGLYFLIKKSLTEMVQMGQRNISIPTSPLRSTAKVLNSRHLMHHGHQNEPCGCSFNIFGVGAYVFRIETTCTLDTGIPLATIDFA
jgi:hypothetical protein